METELIKKMFDACYQAKRTRDLLPPLPRGTLPSFIQYLDVIGKMEKEDANVKISDISQALGLPRPGVTRTVKDMVEKGYLTKITCPRDKRITYVTMTDKGRNLSKKYDGDYFKDLSVYLDEISTEDAECMIRTIEKFHDIMKAQSKRSQEGGSDER